MYDKKESMHIEKLLMEDLLKKEDGFIGEICRCLLEQDSDKSPHEKIDTELYKTYPKILTTFKKHD